MNGNFQQTIYLKEGLNIFQQLIQYTFALKEVKLNVYKQQTILRVLQIWEMNFFSLSMIFIRTSEMKNMSSSIS